MSIDRTATTQINVTVLGREASALGYTGGISISEDGLTATFLDTDDTTLVDSIVTAYQSAMTDRNNVINALNSNNNYLNIASPTNAQVVAQVKALTQQINGLVKILNKRGVID